MAEPTREQTEHVIEQIFSIRTCMFTTLGADGALESRPMTTQGKRGDFDGSLYFVTQRSQDVAQQVEANPRVNLGFAGSGDWVSVQGRARISDDRAMLEKLWSAADDAFTTGGPQNPENVLLVVEPEAAQYWDSPAAPVMLFSMLKAKVTGDEPREGNSGTVEF